jgi:hypothetical protein
VPPSSSSSSPRRFSNQTLTIVPGIASIRLDIVLGLLDPKDDGTVIFQNFRNHLPRDDSVSKLNLIRYVNNNKISLRSYTLLRLAVSRMNWWALGVGSHCAQWRD